MNDLSLKSCHLVCHCIKLPGITLLPTARLNRRERLTNSFSMLGSSLLIPISRTRALVKSFLFGIVTMLDGVAYIIVITFASSFP